MMGRRRGACFRLTFGVGTFDGGVENCVILGVGRVYVVPLGIARRRGLDPASGVEPVFAVEDLVLRGLVVMVIVFGRVR